MTGFRSIAIACAVASVAFAADCSLDQPRKEGDPSGAQIAKAVGVQTELTAVCDGRWRVNDEKRLENSFNHSQMIYNISRTDNTQDLRYCQDAFKNIIEQCISKGNYWGGTWSLNGETYSISNSAFPGNPLSPTEDGGPVAGTSTSSSSAGPITPPPKPPTPGSGTYLTRTQSIDGLTANSATSTSQDGHPTILPIWFVGPGLGIIVIPAADAPIGPVPPPAGYPTLTIGEDGKPSTSKKEDEQSKATSTSPSSSASSSCSQCSNCNIGTVDISVDEDALGDVSGDIPVIIPGGTTPPGVAASPISTPTPTPASAPLQSAKPIGSPDCMSAGLGSKASIPDALGGTNADLTDLLYKLRQEVCAGTCSTAGRGIPGDAVSTDHSNDGCELRVALTDQVEAYMYRGSPATGEQWQQCWDSTDAIINKCVQNSANKGWWNGNHVYQFYEGGVRPLNDGNAKNNFKLTKFLGWSTGGLTCEKDCHGFVPSPDWCNANCQRSKRNVVPEKSTFSAHRSADNFLQPRAPVKCDIPFEFPDYPETTKAGNGESPRSAGTFTDIINNGWWDAVNQTPFQSGMCLRKLRKTTKRIPNTEYATEHIYEKQIVITYLSWLRFDFAGKKDGGFNAGHIADCPTLKLVFNRQSTTPGSPFLSVTPAQALANAMSCSGGNCPAADRTSEFFILQDNINGLKAIVLGQMNSDAGFRQMSCKNKDGWEKNHAKLYLLANVFEYLSNPGVAAVFNKVNARVRDLLHALDNDPFYAAHTPQALKVPDVNDTVHYIQHNGWLGSYDYFMRMFLYQAQEKSRQFAHSCMIDVISQIQSSNLSKQEKKELSAMLAANRQSGMLSDAMLGFGVGYTPLMGSEWS